MQRDRALFESFADRDPEPGVTVGVGVEAVRAESAFSVQVSALKVAPLAVGAAVLWAAGTVLGRLVSATVGPRDLTVLRYSWGLPAAAGITWQTHAALNPGWHNIWGLVLLALIPGLAALSMYYVGLRATPASRATFAELPFPGTAATVGVLFLNSHLSTTQWLGFAVVVVSITGLGWRERSRPPAVVESIEPATSSPH